MYNSLELFSKALFVMFALWSNCVCRPYHWRITEHSSLLCYWIIHVWTAVGLLVKYT